jgi:hypothetical protein
VSQRARFKPVAGADLTANELIFKQHIRMSARRAGIKPDYSKRRYLVHKELTLP